MNVVCLLLALMQPGSHLQLSGPMSDHVQGATRGVAKEYKCNIWLPCSNCDVGFETGWLRELAARRNRAMHCMNGNTSTAMASKGPDPLHLQDPWGSYRKKEAAQPGKESDSRMPSGRAPVNRCPWESTVTADGLQLLPGQLVIDDAGVEGAPAFVLAALFVADVNDEATGYAFATVRSLEVLSGVRSRKALSLLLPGRRVPEPTLTHLGLSAGAVTKLHLACQDRCTQKLTIKPVTLINLGAIPVKATSATDVVITVPDSMELLAEVGSRHCSPEVWQRVRASPRRELPKLLQSQLPKDLNFGALELYGWRFQEDKKVRGANHSRHGVTFRVPSAKESAVLTLSGVQGPLLFRPLSRRGASEVSAPIVWGPAASKVAGCEGLALSRVGLGIRVKSDQSLLRHANSSALVTPATLTPIGGLGSPASTQCRDCSQALRHRHLWPA